MAHKENSQSINIGMKISEDFENQLINDCKNIFKLKTPRKGELAKFYMITGRIATLLAIEDLKKITLDENADIRNILVGLHERQKMNVGYKMCWGGSVINDLRLYGDIDQVILALLNGFINEKLNEVEVK